MYLGQKSKHVLVASTADRGPVTRTPSLSRRTRGTQAERGQTTPKRVRAREKWEDDSGDALAGNIPSCMC